MARTALTTAARNAKPSTTPVPDMYIAPQGDFFGLRVTSVIAETEDDLFVGIGYGSRMARITRDEVRNDGGTLYL